MKDVGIVCQFCGASITDVPYARKGKDYCCEGCFLKEKEFRVVQETRDDAKLQAKYGREAVDR